MIDDESANPQPEADAEADDPPYFHHPDQYPTPAGPDEHTHDPSDLEDQ